MEYKVSRTLSQRYPGEMLPVRVIPLTQGKYALIDPEDYWMVSEFIWCAARTNKTRWYAATNIPCGNHRKTLFYMHHLIHGAQSPDHVNGNGLDNRRKNLRDASQSQNLANKGLDRNNTSGFKGVSKDGNKWVAYIMKDGKNKRLGCFGDPKDAARAYDRAAIAAFGEYALTNQQMGLIK